MKGHGTEEERVSIGGGMCGELVVHVSLRGDGCGLTGLACFLATKDRILSGLEEGCERIQ